MATDREIVKLINRIVDIFADAERRLLALIASGLADPNALSQISAIRREAEKIIEQSYNLSLEEALKLLQKAYEQGIGELPETAIVVVNPNPVTFQTAEYFKLLQNVKFQLLRSVEDVYRTIVYEVSGAVAVGSNTRIGAAKEALSALAKEGIAGFVDKTGREWELASYIEMTTRTAAQNAFREGRVYSIQASGGDLAIIRSAPSHCPDCAKWRNKIVSISGKSDKYPPLERAVSENVFHPNCRCTLAKFVEELTIIDTVETVPNYYEEEQQLRSLEREARAVRRALAADKDNEDLKQKLKDITTEIETLVDETEGLRRKPAREYPFGAR